MFKKIKHSAYQLKCWWKDIFVYPRETLSLETSQDYNKYWEDKRGDSVGVLSDWQKMRADIILALLPPDEKMTIADIGCGEGSILKYIHDKRQVTRMIGYDSSLFVLEKAKAIGIDDTVQMDISVPDELDKIKEVDYTLMLEILEHVPQSERVLDTAFSRSQKGVFFSFPNTGFFTYRLRLLFGKFPKQWVTFPNEHLRFWTARDLRYWLDALGYTDYTIKYYKGVPVLSRIFPSLFAAAFVVFLPK